MSYDVLVKAIDGTGSVGKVSELFIDVKVIKRAERDEERFHRKRLQVVQTDLQIMGQDTGKKNKVPWQRKVALCTDGKGHVVLAEDPSRCIAVRHERDKVFAVRVNV